MAEMSQREQTISRSHSIAERLDTYIPPEDGGKEAEMSAFLLSHSVIYK